MKPYYQDRTRGITLYLGDCRAVLPTLDAGVVDVTLTDPPYNAKKQFGTYTNDHQPWPEWCAWLDEIVTLLRRASPDVFAFLSQTAYRHYVRLGQHVPDWTLCWYKPLALSVTALPLMPHWEPIAYWGTTRKKDGAFWGSDVVVGNVVPNHHGHPTEKPLPVMRALVQRFSPEIVLLDPFAGSGTTLVAAQIEGRRAIGIEIEERWAETAARRLERGEQGARRPEQGLLFGRVDGRMSLKGIGQQFGVSDGQILKTARGE